MILLIWEPSKWQFNWLFIYITIGIAQLLAISPSVSAIWLLLKYRKVNRHSAPLGTRSPMDREQGLNFSTAS